MKRWLIPTLWIVVSSCPVPPAMADDPFEPGRATRFSVPLITIPFGSNKDPEPAPPKDKEDSPIIKEFLKEKDQEEKKEDKRKAAIDKKIDDAINKAWGRETSESSGAQK